MFFRRRNFARERGENLLLLGAVIFLLTRWVHKGWTRVTGKVSCLSCWLVHFQPKTFFRGIKTVPNKKPNSSSNFILPPTIADRKKKNCFPLKAKICRHTRYYLLPQNPIDWFISLQAVYLLWKILLTPQNAIAWRKTTQEIYLYIPMEVSRVEYLSEGESWENSQEKYYIIWNSIHTLSPRQPWPNWVRMVNLWGRGDGREREILV